MTNENRRQNIAIEAARGDASFESAEILLGAKKFADATSRAYYGAFHYARALLLMLGEEPVTHAGVERLLHRDLVRSGLLPSEIARQFSFLEKMGWTPTTPPNSCLPQRDPLKISRQRASSSKPPARCCGTEDGSRTPNGLKRPSATFDRFEGSPRALTGESSSSCQGCQAKCHPRQRSG